MPYFGSLLLDQPLLKLLFPKQPYIPANYSRPGTWRVVVTSKIPLSCNFLTSSVWLKVLRLLPSLYQVIWGRGRPLNIHFTPWLVWFSKRKTGEPHRVTVSGPKGQESDKKNGKWDSSLHQSRGVAITVRKATDLKQKTGSSFYCLESEAKES